MANNKTIDFNKVKIGKKLGAGMFGTTYLAMYKDKQYALKIQHILKKETKKSFKNEMWRELDLYEYIKKLNKQDQIFFTNLYAYEIYDNCDHVQKRKRKNTKILENFKELDESSWCTKYLLEYKGSVTLDTFLQKNKLNQYHIYSLCLQICKIVHILSIGGYSHNDLHPDNIMVTKTNDKYFDFMNKKIPNFGYQLSAIDFAKVLNKKYKLKYKKKYQRFFLVDFKKWIFDEMFYTTSYIFDGVSRYIVDCKKQNKQLPWERKDTTLNLSIKLMLVNHLDFCNEIKKKYIDKFPKGKELLKIVIKNRKTKKTIMELVGEDKNKKHFWDIMNRIIFEFQTCYPKQHSKYWKWCSWYESLLPLNVMQQILLINNSKDYIDYFISHFDN